MRRDVRVGACIGSALVLVLATAAQADPPTTPGAASAPAAGAFTPRSMHGAVVLPNGSVLVVGGVHNWDEPVRGGAIGHNDPLTTAEIIDPVAGTTRATGSLSGTR